MCPADVRLQADVGDEHARTDDRFGLRADVLQSSHDPALLVEIEADAVIPGAPSSSCMHAYRSGGKRLLNLRHSLGGPLIQLAGV